jgi:hypothetical protein
MEEVNNSFSLYWEFSESIFLKRKTKKFRKSNWQSQYQIQNQKEALEN